MMKLKDYLKTSGVSQHEFAVLVGKTLCKPNRYR
jgi:hypothetical protein